MKILITGGKTAAALKLIKAFEGSAILLGDYGDMPSLHTNSYSFADLGEWNATILAHNLLTKCLDNNVDVLLPLYEAEIIALAKSLLLFEEFGLKVLLPAKVAIQRGKHTFWAIFENGNIVFHHLPDGKLPVDLVTSDLNGAYYFDANTATFTLLSLPDPA